MSLCWLLHWNHCWFWQGSCNTTKQYFGLINKGAQGSFGKCPIARPKSSLAYALWPFILPKHLASPLLLIHSRTKLKKYVVVSSTDLGGGEEGLFLNVEEVSSISWAPTHWQLVFTLVRSFLGFARQKKIKSMPFWGTLVGTDSAFRSSFQMKELSACRQGVPRTRLSSVANNCLWLRQGQPPPGWRRTHRCLKSLHVREETSDFTFLKDSNKWDGSQVLTRGSPFAKKHR